MEEERLQRGRFSTGTAQRRRAHRAVSLLGEQLTEVSGPRTTSRLDLGVRGRVGSMVRAEEDGGGGGGGCAGGRRWGGDEHGRVARRDVTVRWCDELEKR